jgi:hypothetical protein
MKIGAGKTVLFFFFLVDLYEKLHLRLYREALLYLKSK